jgi:trimeric autotransporter adhesin
MTFYTFANATTSIPLANLDANFATPITLGNTAVTINGTFSSIGNLTLNNATIASGNSTVTKETVTTITSPAATNLTIQSAGTTAMTIDTSQNVGIGTTSPSYKLDVSQNTSGGTSIQIQNPNATANSNAGYIARTNNGNEYIQLIGYAQASGYLQFNNATGGVVETVNSQPLAFWTNATERMRIDSSGNLLVGTTSVLFGSNTQISVKGNSTNNAALVGVSHSDGSVTGYFNTYGGTLNIGSYTNSSFTFNTNNAERMRIDSSGNLLVGTTAQLSTEKFRVESSASWAVAFRTTHNTSGDINLYLEMGSNTNNTSSYFINASTTGVGGKFYVYGNGNVQNFNNSYGAISDVSLKENIVDATPKLADLMQVQIRNYNFKTDETKTKQIGVVAQELETVFPSMIETDKDGIKGVKYSVFVPMLIKALQELSAKVDAQAAEITALKAKVGA